MSSSKVATPSTPLTAASRSSEAAPSNPNARQRPRRTKVFQWVPTDDDQLATTEQLMLRSIAGRYTQRRIAGLNTIYSEGHIYDGSRSLLLLHGFGGGVANWVPNWKALTAHTNVYAVDLPGFARSDHPDIQFKSEHDAIGFMCDSVLAWVKESGIRPPFDIGGHSFGAYVAAQFSLRYPSLVSRLVLADPWGVPPLADLQLPLRFRILLKLFYCGNPLSVLRGAGPWGPDLLPKVRKDFADRWAQHLEDPTVFYDYTYHCNAHPVPTGERAFQACCTGAAFAKLPLLEALKGLDTRIKLRVLYGVRTWMDKDAGRSLASMFDDQGGDASIHYVSDAGHQLNTDNADGFNEQILAALDLDAL